MTSMIRRIGGEIAETANGSDCAQASRNFERLIKHVADLYCMGDVSTISTYEMKELSSSVAYVLGILDAAPDETLRTLDVEDPIALWRKGLEKLDVRMDNALGVWREIVSIMPPIRNVALRDTLSSLGELRRLYDTRFAAHEVPCEIDYQLSKPVEFDLPGLDYIEAWLAQLLKETRWIARFDDESCIDVLEAVCPDYRGLHVNLVELLRPHETDLVLLDAAQ